MTIYGKLVPTMNKHVSTVINKEKCTGCGLCLDVCPSDTLSLINGKAAVTGRESLGCGHCEAVCPTGAIKVTANDEAFSFHTANPSEKWQPPGKHDLDSLINLMRSRRSCRNYQERQVDKSSLEDLVKIGITAPSGTNSQCWTFSLALQREQVVSLGNLVAGYFQHLNKLAQKPYLRLADKLFSKGSLSNYYENHYDSVKKGLDRWQRDGKDSLFHGATAAIIIGSSPGASCPQDDALLATQNILLGAHAMGLGTCLIGFAVHALNNEKNIKKALKIPANEIIYSVIALGHPNEKYQHLSGRRKPLIRTI